MLFGDGKHTQRTNETKKKKWIECWVHYWMLGCFGKYKILFNPNFVKHYFYKKGEWDLRIH